MLVQSHRSATLPLRSTTHASTPKDQSLDQIVPGDYPQVEQDLGSFSASSLELLARSGVRVAVLDDGETLAESPALPGPSRGEYAVQRDQANRLFKQFVPGELQEAGRISMDGLYEIGKRFTLKMREANLDFSTGLALGPFQPFEIAERRNIPSEHLKEWTEAFHHLNEGLITESEGGWEAPAGLLVLPHTYHQNRPVAEVRLRDAKQVSGEFVKGSLGLHRAEDRLVLLHKDYVGAPAAELGNYRLSIHEMGHALDHVLDRITGLPGFGTLHRKTVDALYEADLKKAEAQPTLDVFTSERASEDVREYFAEAVEAYLTENRNDRHEKFRVENSRQGLKQRNPRLYDYVEGIFATDFREAVPSAPPMREILDLGFPDPEIQVHRVA